MRRPLYMLSILVLTSLSLTVLSSCSGGGDPVVALAYDSFTAEWGPGKALADLFLKRTGMSIRYIGAGDAGQALSAAIEDGSVPRADVIIGLDRNLLPKAVAAGVLEPYEAKDMKGIAAICLPAVVVEGRAWATPFDYGYFAIIADRERLEAFPSSLADLARPEYARKLILMDPRSSTPGLGFLEWTVAAFGEPGYEDYWRALKPSILTMAPGWDLGYGMFTKGEAPLVLSYTTSPAYHKIVEGSDRYVALEFSEGHPLQVEMAALLKGARHPEGARAFIDFLITDEAQAILPATQWMFPAREGVKLPQGFEAAARPAKLVSGPVSSLPAATKRAMEILSEP